MLERKTNARTASRYCLARASWGLVLAVVAVPGFSLADEPLSVSTTTAIDCASGGIRFTVQICTVGTADLTNVTVTNTLPIGMTFASGSLTAVDGANNPVDVALCEPPVGQTIQVCLAAPLGVGECVLVSYSATFAEALCNHVVVTASGPPVSQGDEGCTPGFWKNHFSAWEPTGFAPGDDFDAVFGTNAFNPDRTLEQAINQGGGGIKALGRHAVAALLNAAHNGVDFGMTVAQVRQTVQEAVTAGGSAIEAAQNTLELRNEMGCPLGGEDTGGGGSPETVSASDTKCLDTLLNEMVACVCDGDAGGDVFDIDAFCESLPPDSCDPEAVFSCLIAFEDFIFSELFAAEEEFLLSRCAQCCPDDPACACLVIE